MRQVLLRAICLLRRPAVLSAFVLVAGGGCALLPFPLFEVPGYELALALSVAVGLLGGIFGAAAAFQERRILAGRDPRPLGALPFGGAAGGAWMATSAALILALGAALPPLLAATFYGLLSTRCEPFVHLAFVPLLVIPSAALAVSAGSFAGFGCRGARGAAGLYLLLVFASALWTGLPLVFGPQVFAFNHFAGYLPGPLYDEALTVTASLAWFRLQTLLLAGVLILATALRFEPSAGPAARPGGRRGCAVSLGLFATCAGLLEARGPALGFRQSESALIQELGGVRETHHALLYYPRGKPREELERLARDVDFRVHQLSEFFGTAPGAKLKVFVYRDEEAKRRLVGAARTQFAKPWRGEIHINDAATFPHAVLKHELAHLVAAPFGSPPFAVTARGFIWPIVGVIEGMAVAADAPADDLTLHEWAAGMRRQGLAPDLRGLLKPTGFYTSAPGRAYTLAGSFFRYLSDAYGSQKLRAIYAHGDFEGVYGRSLDALATEWERFLSTVALDPAAVHQAFARFRHPSIFARPCAREVASLREEADAALYSDPERAAELYGRCAQLQPEEPSFKLGQARAQALLHLYPEALATLRQLQTEVEKHPQLLAEVQLALADLSSAMRRRDEAFAALRRALDLQVSPAIDRTAHLKLAALDNPVAGPALASYFEPGQEDVKLLVLREALEGDPHNPYLSYLLGRRLTQSREGQLALAYLSQALAMPMPESLVRETRRLKLEALYLAGDCEGVRHEAGALPGTSAALLAKVNDLLARCDYEARAYHGALVPSSPFR